MPFLKKVLITFLFCFSGVLFAEESDLQKPVLGRLIERNGLLYDTFYYHMNGEPQFLLQKYDEIAIPNSVKLKNLQSLTFNGIKFSDIISEVTFNAQNCRAFKIKLDEPDRKKWLQIRDILAKNGIEAWPVLTYHAKNSPVVLDGTMNLVFPKYTSREEQEKIMEIYGLKTVEIVDEENNFYTVALPAGSDPFAIANSLFERQFVSWAQPNWPQRFKLTSVTPNDPYFKDQWHLTKINAPQAWETETAENKDVRIAIIDSGVDLTHPDLNILTELGKDYLGNLGGAPNTSGNGSNHVDVPHGTACAGLAAAKTNNGKGVAAACWGCPIIPIRVIPDDYDDENQALYINTIYNAIKYAVDNGAWVISNSWGAEDKEGNKCVDVPADNNTSNGVLYGMSKGRNGKGTIFLWAAGNSTCDTSKNSFLKDNNFLTISALAESGSLADYSNYGTEVDLSAPAGNNTTDIQGTQYGYAYNGIKTLDSGKGDYTSGMSGTSAATPVAAGAVAIMLAANPNFTFSGAMNCIKVSAAKPSTKCSRGEWTTQSDEWLVSGSKEHSPCFGFGIVDAKAMVENAKDEEICPGCIPVSTLDGCYDNYYDKDDDCDGTVDNDCENGGIGKAGDACSADSDCINTAKTPKCIHDEGWEGGYCSATCTKNTDCYKGSKDVECYEGQCIAKCSYNEIRSGYACIENKILPKGAEPVANCGNSIIEEGEKCDSDYKSCQEINSNFTKGSAFCNQTCSGYDTSTCAGGSGDPAPDPEDDDSDSIPDDDNSDSGKDHADSGDSSDSSDSTDSANSGDPAGNDGDSDSEDSSSNGSETCGNGIVEDNEQCDDGNTISGDGCSKYCMFEDEQKKSGSGGCSLLPLD